MANLQQELRYANEGLEQMQRPEAGYFEDWNNKQPREILKFERDVKAQTEMIVKLEKKISRERID